MKIQLKKTSSRIDKVASIILAGGQGTRLYPLTSKRSKPSVVFGGRYRLIDIPISNSLNSRIRNIYIISQFYASSLNQHIKNTFDLDNYQGGSIEMLSPQETEEKKMWYKGTADAVRQNLKLFLKTPAEYFLILSGDQLYNMDLSEMLKFAQKKDADLTIASIPVIQKEASRLGILKIDENSFVTDFVEKPTDTKVLMHYHLPKEYIKQKKLQHLNPPLYLASMGIYIFKRSAMEKLLTEFDGDDFGKHLIPAQIQKLGNTAAYIYNGYWEDIGTIKSFYDANLALTTNTIDLDLYNEEAPIYAETLNLPSPRITNTQIKNSIISLGSIIEAKEITHSMIGVRSRILEGSIVRDSILLGNQVYHDSLLYSGKHEELSYQIGKNCIIEKTIIDEHVNIGNHVKLTNEKGLKEYDGDGIFIRDGIIVITSGTTLPDHFTL